jgi:hypothetical protein
VATDEGKEMETVVAYLISAMVEKLEMSKESGRVPLPVESSSVRQAKTFSRPEDFLLLSLD